MKTIGIIPNMDRDPALVFTREVMDYLIQKGCELLVSTEIAEKTGRPWLAVETHDIYGRADFFAVLGGDGTILQVSGQAALCSIPLLGINLGNMGYLTAVERDGAFHALDQVLAGNYKLEQRMMLSTSIVPREGSLTLNEPILALNDACISRGVSTTMIDLELWINDEYIHTYRGDGIVVATPTGSTAYNLSAGGPILKPDVEMIAITPICAHMLFNRSFVVSGVDKVKIKMSGHSHNEGLLVMDGHSRFPLKNGDEVHICRSSCRTAIMKTNLLGFYDILRQKMKA